MQKTSRLTMGVATFAVVTLMALLLFGQSLSVSLAIGAFFGLFVLYLAGQPKLIAIFAIPELRQKIFITLLFLTIYRIGYFVPLPFIDQKALNESLSQRSSTLSQVLGFVSLFSGGNLSNACIFALGIMPYISASIILQLLAAIYPPLEKLKKEGEAGQKKIN